MTATTMLLPPPFAFCVYPNCPTPADAAAMLLQVVGGDWTPEAASVLDDVLVQHARVFGAIGERVRLSLSRDQDQIGDCAVRLDDFMTFNTDAGVGRAESMRALSALADAGLVGMGHRNGEEWIALAWPRVWGAGNALRYRQRAERLFAEGKEMVKP